MGGTLLAGCGSSTPSVASYDVPVGQRAVCRDFIKALPRSVDGHQRVKVEGSEYAAAYSDGIVLRCGVGLPEGYERTSFCSRANGVDWYTPEKYVEDQSTDPVITAIHRVPMVEVTMSADLRPPVGVMVDLAPVIKAHTRRTGACA